MTQNAPILTLWLRYRTWGARMTERPRCRVLAGYSWLNMVEIVFGIITRQAHPPRAPSPPSRTSPTAAGRFTGACDDRYQPFTWSKTLVNYPA